MILFFRRWMPWLLPIVTVAIVVFIRTCDFSNIRLDDFGYTAGCPFVKDGFSLENVIGAFSDPGNGAIWMPLTYVSYMLDISLLGGEWAAHHFTNVILHVINSVLMFILLKKLLPRFGCHDGTRCSLAAMVATLVWMVHPMRVESVAWIAARKEELWSCFAFVFCLIWMRFLDRGEFKAWVFSFVCFVLACLSKPTAMCIPLLAIAIHRLGGCKQRIGWAYYVPFFVVSLAIGLLAVYSQSNPTGMHQIDIYDTTFGWRIVNAMVSLGLYVWHTFVPVGIHFDYRAVFMGKPLGCGTGFATLVLAVVMVTLALIRFRGKPAGKVLSFAVCWFLVPLIPALGIFGIVGDHARADRYTYLAAGSLAFLLAWMVCQTNRKWTMAILTLMMILGEVALTWPIVSSFRNDFQVFSRILDYDKNHWRALHYVGAEYCARLGKGSEGIAMIRRSMKLSPRPSTAATLAYVLALRGEKGDFDEVKKLGSSVSDQPKIDTEGMMLDALGVVALREGNDRAAMAYLTAALSAPKRSHTKDHSMLNLGIALANIGCDREAMSLLGKLWSVNDKWVRTRAREVIGIIRKGNRRPRIAWK